MEKERTKSVGIWIRVSTEDQAKGESPEHHEKRARMYAESKGWNVIEVYHLEAVSGKSVMAHPECQRMLKDIKRKHISGLIFSKLARMARNTKELLDFADLFRESNADLISLQESIDTSTPAGRLLYTMLSALAEWERAEIASRVAASVPIRAKLGKPLGGAAPFGYQWKEKKLITDPKEAPVRKLMYELFLKHRRAFTVAKLLNEQGYRTRGKAKFTDETVKRLLEDPSAKGLRKANYTKSLGPGKGWQMKPEDEWVYSEIEPIVSADIWDQANALLTERKNGKRPSKKVVQLFAGFVWCHCGTKMYVLSNSPKYVCLKCRNKIPIEEVEGIFHEELKDFLFSPEEISHYLEGADQSIKEKEALLGTLENEKSKVKAEMDNLYRLYQDGSISSRGFGEKHKPLEERFEQIGDQVPTLQGEIDFLKIKLKSSDQIINEARDLHSRWPDMTLEEKRQIVEVITDKIVIGDPKVSITLLYLPSSTSSEVMVNTPGNPRAVRGIYKITLRGEKAPSPTYPKELKSLGDHIRKRRLDLGLTQDEVAMQLGAHRNTLSEWETTGRPPDDKHLGRIYAFLGYRPDPCPTAFPEKVRYWRQFLGISQTQLSEAIGLNHSAVRDWEAGVAPKKCSLERLKVFLSDKLGKEVVLS